MPTIECTEQQAFIIERCLEVCSRFSMGQIKIAAEDFLAIQKGHKEYACPDGNRRTRYEMPDYLEELLKPVLFPELAANASYGVGCDKIEKGQLCYEMLKVLQNYRAKRDHHDRMSVLHSSPLHYSKEPLMKVKE